MFRRLNFFLIIISPMFLFTAPCIFGENKLSSSDTTSSVAADSVSSVFSSGLRWLPNHQIMTILAAMIFFFLAFILIIYLRQPLLSLSDRHPRYARLLTQIISIFLITCWILIIYITVQEMLNLSDIFSFIILGIIGFAVAFAFQDILKDVIAGLILPFQKHLEIGCKIGCPDFWGEIVRIGLREIEIKKSDGRLAILPTSVILKERLIEIYCEKENCPVTLDFYLPVDANIEESQQIAYKSAIVSPYLFLKKPVTITIRAELTNGCPLVKMTLSAFLQKIDFQPLFINDMTTSMLRFMKPDPVKQ